MRALLLGAMAKGESRIEGALESPDVAAMVAACEALGADFKRQGDLYLIRGVGGRPRGCDCVIDSGNSGLVLRFVGAMAALASGKTVIVGDHSICTQRLVEPLLSGLNQLGATAISTRGNGLAPISVTGPISAGRASLCGAESQPVSALLMAATLLDEPTELEVIDSGEKPFIEITLQWLKKLGHSVRHDDYKHYRVEGRGAHAGFSYYVPGDWSSAAYPLIAARIHGADIDVTNLDANDVQGDKAAVDLDSDAIDINPIIDALPILAVFGCYRPGGLRLYNGAIARRKECDRIGAICAELRKMGADIEELEDGLIVRESVLRGTEVESHGDHRIAMSLAIAATGARGETTVRDTACVAKSYPGFVESMQSIGADLCEV